MKLAILALALLIGHSSVAHECTVSFNRFATKASVVQRILESKGYQVTANNPRYRLESSLYDDYRGRAIIIVNLFERGNSNRLDYVKKVFPAYGLFGGFKLVFFFLGAFILWTLLQTIGI